MLSFIEGPYPGLALFLFAFAESSFFPIPPDVMLIPLILNRPEHYIFFASITTAGSVLGGMAGYWIGLRGGRPLMTRFFDGSKIDTVEHYYDKYNAWATGIAGLTPLPYKIFTIGAGTFKVGFKVFVFASILSRGARFFAVALISNMLGVYAMEFLKKYFNLVTVVFVVLLVGGFLFFGYMAKNLHRRMK